MRRRSGVELAIPNRDEENPSEILAAALLHSFLALLTDNFIRSAAVEDGLMNQKPDARLLFSIARMG